MAVKLHSEAMSDSYNLSAEQICHSIPFHRIWHEGEFCVINDVDVKYLKKCWEDERHPEEWFKS